MFTTVLFIAPAFLVLNVFVPLTSSVKLPSYLRTCSRSDPKINECALKNGRYVIPYIIPGDRKIRLPPLDPLVLEKLVVSPQGNSQSAGLTLVCKKCNITGLGLSQLQAIKVDHSKNHLDLDLRIPSMIILGKYEVSGRVLILPITGKGQANITLYDLKVNLGLDWKLTKKKGEDYSQITTYKVHFTAGRLHIYLSNLFNGDRLLGENMNTFLNENWQDVLKDFTPAVSQTIGETIKLILNNIFDLIPFDLAWPK